MNGITADPRCFPFSGQPQTKWVELDPKHIVQWLVDEARPADWLDCEARPVKVHPPNGLEAVIEESRRLLDLPVNWDDEGALPMSSVAWSKAAELLRAIGAALPDRRVATLPLPVISACADGSIDLLWRTQVFKLLINIQPTTESDFYSESADGMTLKGTFRAGVNDSALARNLIARGYF